MTGVVPLLNAGRLPTAQYEDIKRLLRLNHIPFVESHRTAGPAYLCVREKDHVHAQELARREYREYALVERVRWQREWQEAHRGSYWRWLVHQWKCNAKLMALSVFRSFT